LSSKKKKEKKKNHFVVVRLYIVMNAFRALQQSSSRLGRPSIRAALLGGIRTQQTTTVLVTSTKTTPEDIINECQKIRESIQALNDRYKGPLEKSSQKNTVLPFVFLLGNHSSGKSSFVNYVCDRKVQTAGVAPTDDMFTIIVPGPADVDRDGPSLIGDPDMGFSGLRSYGPGLIHHTKLKVRSNVRMQNFMLVDSPGMIDSPMVRDQYGASRHAAMDRGYDFEGVCRWFSERADVILLFFDPDKPGTTGETLSILTNSLVGTDHKLHIVLNKADQFRKIHDFARAYGSLCWNLSKVIQRKDLPRVYTMCLPKGYRDGTMENPMLSSSPSEVVSTSGANANASASPLQGALVDLEETLSEVVHEVFNAPKRRVDNEITRLTDSISLLQMHMAIVDDLVKQYRQATWNVRLAMAAAVTGSTGAIGISVYLMFPMEATAAIVATTLGSTGLLWFFQSKHLHEQAKTLTGDDAMVHAYKRLYAKKASDKDEFLSALWARVHDHLILGMSAEDLKSMDKVRAGDVKELERIQEYDVPNLRRKAAPAFAKSLNDPTAIDSNSNESSTR
jgi:hypothetical protein